MDEKKNEIILFENQGVKLEVNLKDYMLKGYAVNTRRLEYLEKMNFIWDNIYQSHWQKIFMYKGITVKKQMN